MSGEAITAKAPAKINLALHVCGRRADGYHLLDSLVVFAGVGDTITATTASEVALEVTGPFGAALRNEPDNLVLRAARLLASRHKITKGASIVLEKNLPVASGIGGGSADAAATLAALARLWSVKLALSDSDLAASLGADVPVCLHGIPAFMSGIGEVIAPAPVPPSAWLVLANPRLPLTTKAVFTALAGRFSPPMTRAAFNGLRNAQDLARALSSHHNTLMAPAIEQMPAISAVLKALDGTQGCLLSRLSGSGPTCFGLFAEEASARGAAAVLRASQPGWWIAPAPMLAGKQL